MIITNLTNCFEILFVCDQNLKLPIIINLNWNKLIDGTGTLTKIVNDTLSSFWLPREFYHRNIFNAVHSQVQECEAEMAAGYECSGYQEVCLKWMYSNNNKIKRPWVAQNLKIWSGLFNTFVTGVSSS